MMAKPKKAKCPKCKYEWWTLSLQPWINCGGCHRKSHREEVLKK